MTRTRRESGQMLLPFLFVLPSFILILIFVVQIGQLSTEKIRQQFALDAAASAEMEQYTDLLNRLAYVNGVFPHRIFQGGMGNYGGGSMLYPSLVGPIDEGTEKWPIRFGGDRTYANTPDPPLNFGVLHAHLPGIGGVAIEEANRVAYDYISVYQWLGDVATAQKVVFENTVNNKHFMLQKSMQYNLHNNPANPDCKDFSDQCGSDAKDTFSNLNIRMHYLSGFKHCPVIITIGGKKYTGEMAGAFDFQGSGLFQLATIPQDEIRRAREGFLVQNHWKPPKNYFGVDFGAAVDPYVQSFVSSDGGEVWPDPTPKYVTRLFPAPRKEYEGLSGGEED